MTTMDGDASTLMTLGLDGHEAQMLSDTLQRLQDLDPPRRWAGLCRERLRPEHPFAVHQHLFETVYANWPADHGPPPAWTPLPEQLQRSNIQSILNDRGLQSYEQLHAWSVEHRGDFWQYMVQRLGVPLMQPYASIVDLADGVETPRWLAGAKLNIAESCFGHDDTATAVVFQTPSGVSRLTLGELRELAERVACGVDRLGLQPGDRVGIVMPMTMESVAIYLGLVMAGCAVVGIADSFSPPEIEVRLRIAKAKAVFTQDVVLRAGRSLPLYDKLGEFDCPQAIVLSASDGLAVSLRSTDIAWDEFLPTDGRYQSVACDPDDVTNVLFSSGTTGEPKAIPWTHTTPIKCAVDGHIHHDIRPGDVVAWPTSLGWMMGPWLIYAALVNRAAIALYDDVPTDNRFCRFVQETGVTMLGVVPTLVTAWRNSGAVDGCDWSSIRCFSSTGECSNHDDMFYLMSRAGYRPIIEYCGGTEIGGGYITGTVVQPCPPSTFTTPAIGLDFEILDDRYRPADQGEVYLVPPSIGLSCSLLNRDHHATYYDDAPAGSGGRTLRKHGDEIERLPGGFFRAHGRTDDTMNLGGIKTSAAEIERVLVELDMIREAAAVAVSPEGGGPSQLVVYVVLSASAAGVTDELRGQMQQAIKTNLNPLFRIVDVVAVDKLPRTASNKVMRRVLRSQYAAAASTS